MKRNRSAADKPQRSRRRARAAQRHWRPRVERLEDRTLLTVEAFIAGTEGADTIVVDHVGSETVVTRNGQQFRYDDADLVSLTIHALGGNDTILIGRTGLAPLTIDAGSGNDEVTLGTGRFHALNSHTISIDGGGDPLDALEIHDELSAGDTRDYQISSEYFTRRNDPTVAILDGFKSILLLQNEESTDTEVGHVEAGVFLAIADLGIDDHDSYFVGQEALDGLDAIEGTLRLSGDQNDQVWLNDADSAVVDADYEITSSSLPSGGDASVLDLEGTGRIELAGSSPSDALNVDFSTSTSDNTTHVRRTLPNVKWTIRDAGGADTIEVGDGNYAQNIRGEVVVEAAGQNDKLIVNDRFDLAGYVYLDVEPFPIPFSSERHAYTLTADGFQKAETLRQFLLPEGPDNPRTVTAPRLEFDNVADVELWASWTTGDEFGAGDFGTTFAVDGVASGTSLTIIDEVGNSRAVVGGGNYLLNVRGPVTIEGGTGNNVLTIDDSLFVRAPLSANTSYKLDSRFVGLTEFGTFAVGTQQITSPPSPEVFGPELRYARVEEMTLEGSQAADRFEVLRTPDDVPIILRGSEGEDMFNVGGGRFLSRIRGPVTVNGGSDDDHLVIDDRDSTLDARYVVKSNSIGVNDASIVAPLLSYSLVQDVRLEGSIGDNRFQVDSTRAAVDYSLRGNEGADEFRIDAGGLRSDVVVSGGDPSTPPGDSLHITGTGAGTAVYTPDLSFPSAGAVTVGDDTVRFSGLEPVSLENFDAVTMVTPRSHDLVDIAPAADGWSTISGTSGHPSLLLPFESLSFRDVRNVTLNTAALDFVPFQFPPTPTGQIFPPFPNDTVNIREGALSARGLEEFSIVTGGGANFVHDETLKGGVPVSARLNLDGLGGFTRLTADGVAPQLDFEQLDALRHSLTARDASGLSTYQIATTGVASMVMAEPQPLVRAIAENQELTLDAVDGVQRIAGDFAALEVAPAPSGSELVAVLLGDSTLNLGAIVFDAFEIQGTRPFPEGEPAPEAGPQTFGSGPSAGELLSQSLATADNITLRPILSDLPVLWPPTSVTHYGPEDTISWEGGAATDGSPLPTRFALDFESLNLWDIELLVRPTDPLAQLGFTVVADAAGAGPALAFLGNNLAGDTATVAMPAEGLARVNPGQLIELLVHGVPTILTRGADVDELVALETRIDGGLASSLRQLDSDGRNKIELLVVTDPTAQEFSFDGLGGQDQFDVRYPEPDFRSLAIGLQGYESLGLSPVAIDPLMIFPKVSQRLTPTTGAVSTGNLLLTHDDAVTTSRIKGTSIELLVAPDPNSRLFTRDLSLGYSYQGSEGKYVIKDVEFAGKFDLTVEHKDGTTNTTTIQEEDVVNQQSAAIKIVGVEGGKDEVLVTKSGVEAKAGSKFEAELKSGDDLVVVTTTDGGQAAGTKDEILVTGVGDGSTEDGKAVLVHKQTDATPVEQLDDLKLEKPEYAAIIDALKTKSDQTLLAEKGTPKPEAGDTKVAYDGEATKLDLFVKNVSPKMLETIVKNTDGTTTIEKVGNVVVTVPELAGTGIDPTQPFATFAVVNTLDSGEGSLRAALDAANAWTGEGLAVVTFAIPATDPGSVDVDAHLPGGDANPDAFVIAPLTSLPAVTRGNVVINGQSQHALTGDTNPFGPEIVLAGELAGPGVSGLHLASPANLVHGLNIQKFGGNGILIAGNDNTLTGNYIGTTADGMAALGNGETGVHVLDSAGNRIGGSEAGAGNIVSGNLRGVWIQGFAASANHVAGNYLGVGADGSTPITGNEFGLIVEGGAGNVIGGTNAWERNVISGNGRMGIHLAATQGTIVQGNYLGTDATGTELVPVRTRENLRVSDDVDSLIGGTDAGAGNVIAGGSWGIYVSGRHHPTPGTRIQGNRIGTTADGQQPLANIWGVYIDGFVDSDGVTREIRDVLIGGAEPGAGNLISGNQNQGIVVFGPGAQGIKIQGNHIGTDFAGDKAVPNGVGVLLENVSGVLVGGVEQNARNVISGNQGAGVSITGGGNHLLQGNLIGLAADGETPLGNGGGINILNSSGNVIGGADELHRNVIAASTGGYGVAIQGLASTGNLVAGIGTAGSNTVLSTEGNIIAYNAQTGVGIGDDASTGNTIRGNSIHDNGGLGIDMAPGGPTANDELDSDAGPNNLQNAPELRSAIFGSATRVAGQLRSTPSSAFTLDFYASPAADPSGFGEGARWLGSIVVTTDALGVAGFSTDLAAVAVDEFVTATATNAAGSTSEFSNALVVRGRAGGPPGGASAAEGETAGLSNALTLGDLLAVVGHLRAHAANPSWDPTRDPNADGLVTIADVVTVVSAIRQSLQAEAEGESEPESNLAPSVAQTSSGLESALSGMLIVGPGSAGEASDNLDDSGEAQSTSPQLAPARDVPLPSAAFHGARRNLESAPRSRSLALDEEACDAVFGDSHDVKELLGSFKG